MEENSLLDSVSLAVYTFGALAFSALAASYWRERQTRRSQSAPDVLPAFSIVLAVAFLLSIARALDAPPAFGIAQDLVTGLIPGLLVHLAIPQPRAFAATTYILGVAAAVAAERTDTFENAPAWVLAAAALVALAALARQRDASSSHTGRRWHLLLLAMIAASAVLNLVLPNTPVAFVPDYLLLALFAVALYYRERLVFFDLLVKRGAFFALGLFILSLFEPWRHALLLMPLWLAAPWINQHLSRAIERAWLRRPYSAGEAERRFIHDVQGASGEEDLIQRAGRSASEIFQSRAIVDSGIRLESHPGSKPLLSDDLRLLESLSRTFLILRENVRLRELTSRAELKALRAQINPHFLFNTLNAIAGLIPSDPALAESTVEQLAEVFRYTLRNSDNEWVRLNEEMQFVTAYLGIQQARFGSRLEVEIRIAESAVPSRIPAMSIQPLVENAIKHGAPGVGEIGHVQVSASVCNGRLRIEVTDNGPGFAEHAPEGHGLRNVGQRLAGYYGQSARLGWENLAPGARVWIELPAASEEVLCAS